MSFELAPADKRSPLWLSLAEHLTERLEAARTENDATRTIERTEHTRGRIFELKSLLALSKDRPAIE